MSDSYEKSCGAVVFTKTSDGIRYVIIRSLTGYFGFPKGHTEKNETEEQTALREIREETGLEVQLIPGFRYVDIYRIPQKQGTMKQIVYFLAEYRNQDIHYQKEELSGAILMSYLDAMNCFQWESSKFILSKANEYLLKMEKYHV